MILLTGAGGQVGTALLPRLRPLDEVAIPGPAQLDLAVPSGIDDVLDAIRPDVIVNAAAWTAVDDAEANEEEATRVNGAAVAALAGWARDHDAWLVTLSTDYVLSGQAGRPLVESDPPGPVNAYGRSKLAGEMAALASGAALVVRTSWVVSATHPNFVRTMLSLLMSGVSPEVVDDQHGCPTVAGDLADAIAGMVARATRQPGFGTQTGPRAGTAAPVGIVHLTNTGRTTWFGLAREAAELAGLDPDLVRPCATSDRPMVAARPAWSVLGSERREALGVPALPHWRESLPQVVAAQVAHLARSGARGLA